MNFLLFLRKRDLMSRHLKKDEWLEIVNLYEQYINYDITKKLMYKYIQMKKKYSLLKYNLSFN